MVGSLTQGRSATCTNKRPGHRLDVPTRYAFIPYKVPQALSYRSARYPSTAMGSPVKNHL